MQVPPQNDIGQGPTGTLAQLRILETTDLHANLLPYDYFSDQPAPGIGLAQAASLIRELRTGVDNCLLFDNGDFLQGNPLADWIAQDSEFQSADLHPMIAAMNTLNYDAVTLGNHEFDYGLGFLTNALARTGFPLVSANVLLLRGGTVAADQLLLPPYLLLDRQITGTDGQPYPIRIGVIGFVPPQLVSWNKLVLQGQIATRGILDAARHYIPQMQLAGAEIIIALSHSGISEDATNEDLENASVPLAAVAGVDVILTGHTHQVFPGPGIAPTPAIDPQNGTLHGKPAVMAGCNGSHVGVVDLQLERLNNRWVVRQQRAWTDPVAERDPTDKLVARVPVDPQVLAAANLAHKAILALIREPIGQTEVPLHSYFALVAPDLTIQVVTAAQTAYATNILRGTEWAGLPVLSAFAPCKAGGLSGVSNYIDIPPGPLAMRHAAELCVFPNSLCILSLSGAELASWLEQSAGIFAPIAVGLANQPLLNPEFPCYNFDVIAGVTYEIDPSQPSRTDSAGKVINPASQRVRNLRCNGKLVDPAQRFVITTNSYRVGGGGGFGMAGQVPIIHHSAENTRDIVTRYLRNSSPLNCTPLRTWSFATQPGTTAWFDSAQGGLTHLAAISGQTVTDVGPRPGGLRRFSLSF